MKYARVGAALTVFAVVASACSGSASPSPAAQQRRRRRHRSHHRRQGGHRAADDRRRGPERRPDGERRGAGALADPGPRLQRHDQPAGRRGQRRAQRRPGRQEHDDPGQRPLGAVRRRARTTRTSRRPRSRSATPPA